MNKLSGKFKNFTFQYGSTLIERNLFGKHFRIYFTFQYGSTLMSFYCVFS